MAKSHLRGALGGLGDGFEHLLLHMGSMKGTTCSTG